MHSNLAHSPFQFAFQKNDLLQKEMEKQRDDFIARILMLEEENKLLRNENIQVKRTLSDIQHQLQSTMAENNTTKHKYNLLKDRHAELEARLKARGDGAVTDAASLLSMTFGHFDGRSSDTSSISNGYASTSSGSLGSAGLPTNLLLGFGGHPPPVPINGHSIDKKPLIHSDCGCNEKIITCHHQHNVSPKVRKRNHVKPFACLECGKTFAQKGNLKVHMRHHSGEKPFACEYGCGKSFAQKSACDVHARIHTGEKPFPCPEPGCDKTFRQKSGLNEHLKNHGSRTDLL